MGFQNEEDYLDNLLKSITENKDSVSSEELLSTDSKMKKNVSKKTIRKNITSTTITVKAKGGKHKMTCKIRPYKIKNGKKIYGRWSRDKLD